MTCKVCRCAVTGQLQRQRYTYYHCTSHRGNCRQPYVPEAKLVEEISHGLNRLKACEALVPWIGNSLKAFHSSQLKESKQRISKAENELQLIKDRQRKALDCLLDGTISSGIWTSKNTELEDQAKELSNTISMFKDSPESFMECGVRIFELSQNAHQLFLNGTDDEKRRILNLVFSNITLKDGKLHYTYKKPFDMIAKGVVNQKWWAMSDLNTRPHPYQGCALAN